MANDSILTTVADCLSGVLKGHYTEKKRAERERRGGWIPPVRSYRWTLRDAVFKVMKQAASQASANFTLPFSVRQLYYQVRPLIQEYTEQELSYSYFTPPLVTEYEEIYGSLPGLIYEPRGHFIEPHRDIRVPLGTLDVGQYTAPDYEYDKILYIEKEGFRQIFEAVKLGQRYDMALMTTQGFATRAAKALLAPASRKNITILVAHDCDISGYEIARTLQNATRTAPGIDEIIDLGLTVKQVVAMGLQTESVHIKKEPSYQLYFHLTEEEKEFLLSIRTYHGYNGNRVELNAMTTSQLVSWIEDQLKAHGLQTKVLPLSKW